MVWVLLKSTNAARKKGDAICGKEERIQSPCVCVSFEKMDDAVYHMAVRRWIIWQSRYEWGEDVVSKFQKVDKLRWKIKWRGTSVQRRTNGSVLTFITFR